MRTMCRRRVAEDLQPPVELGQDATCYKKQRSVDAQRVRLSNLKAGDISEQRLPDRRSPHHPCSTISAFNSDLNIRPAGALLPLLAMPDSLLTGAESSE